MIIMQGVSKQLKTFRLKDMNIEIPDGYICGLVGLNGAGKTTLLHLLLGLYRPDKGTVKIDDREYPGMEKEIHDEMGTVLVEELLDPDASVMENGERYGKFYSHFNRQQYLDNLTQFHLAANSRFGKLSKGQKLKCQFAFALACNPRYLILDEPTANFDPEFRTIFLKRIQEFVSDGTRTVLLATHMTEDLDRLADYLIYLEKGNLIYSGDLETFRERYRIVSGEKYKIKLFSKEDLISLEERAYGTKALIRHHGYNTYDPTLKVTYPSIEEFMYFYSKRGDESK